MIGAFVGGGELVLILFALILVPVGLACTAFWIWMLVDCIKDERIMGNEKVAWVLVIALLHFLGAVIYFFAGRKPRPAVGQSPPG